jgi:chitodextrinase
LNNGQWTNLSQFRFNNTAYNTGYPYLTDDGKKLFFCSNAPGGFGGYDIYVSELKNGQWGQPVNLGNQVNTSENEVFPFLHPSGRLYFASRGHHQGRDLDIFYTVNMEGDWQIPVPLEAPVNSKFNDYGLIMNTATDTAYYVSDRDGSADIYTATSTLPTFKTCAEQEENDYCYVFYEPNNNEIDTTAFAYEWDLGDGTKIRDLKAEHCFSAPGTYKVQLNLVDKLTHEVLLAQAIYDFDVEQIEQAYISAPDTIIAGVPVTFDGNETHLKDFTIDAYTWDFGDGYRSSGSRTEHRFNFPGSYELILGVTDKPEDKKSEERKTCVTRRIVVISNKN